MVNKKQIKDKLSEVMDPHLGINIVDMGFICDIRIKGKNVEIDMTLTTPGCPLVSQILSQVESRLNEIEGIGDITVKLVWDPPWTPKNMTKSARKKLGFEGD